MIISGRTAFDRGVLTDLIDAAIQVQPCGIDVTLKTVSKYTGPGTLDFSNTLRNISTTERMPFHPSDTTSDQPPFVHLPLGSYIMEFNETLHTPMDIMGHIYSRSSLWRSGGLIHGGVCDSGYSGAFGALLQVSLNQRKYIQAVVRFPTWLQRNVDLSFRLLIRMA